MSLTKTSKVGKFGSASFLAQGNVLEIGVGSGVNFIHYDLARVDRVYALEPNPGMLRRAEEQRRRTELDPEFSRSSRRTHSLGKRERRYSMGRVLKPGGKLIFFEHGLSPDPRVRRRQERLEPLFRWAFEGCQVTCDIPSLPARAASISNKWTQGTSLHFQSRRHIAGGALRFQNYENETSRNTVPACEGRVLVDLSASQKLAAAPISLGEKSPSHQLCEVHLLPGTTFSSVVARGVYDSAKKAVMTFKEFERWLTLEICGVYHNSRHSALGTAPLEAWKTGFDRLEAGIPEPVDAR